jgi:hypothetical protein
VDVAELDGDRITRFPAHFDPHTMSSGRQAAGGRRANPRSPPDGGQSPGDRPSRRVRGAEREPSARRRDYVIPRAWSRGYVMRRA